MKKGLFLAMIAFVAMVFTSCSKELELDGTTWVATYNETTTMDGVSGTANLTFTLNFKDKTSGTMAVNGSIAISSMGSPIPMNYSENFTYTFDGTNGTMTSNGESQNFSYDKDSKHISMTSSDSEMGVNTTLTFSQK